MTMRLLMTLTLSLSWTIDPLQLYSDPRLWIVLASSVVRISASHIQELLTMLR